MRFSIAKDIIYKTMQHVKCAVDSRATIPILSYVKLVANDGKISLSATNLDTQASESVSCSVDSAGSCAVPTETVIEIIKKMPNNSVLSFALSESGESGSASKLTVSSGHTKFEINVLLDKDFPVVFNDDFDSEISITVKNLSHLIKSTIHSSSNKPEKYNLNGILFHTLVEEGKNFLCAVATDAHRLSFARHLVDSKITIPNKIIPRKSALELDKILMDYENKEVNIKFGSGKVIFTIEDLKYFTKLVDGDFPDYNRVVPKNNTKILEAKRSSLMSALERVSVVYKTGGSGGVKLTVSDGKMSIASTNTGGDAANDEVSATFSGFDNFEVAYNPQFMTEALASIAGDSVRFSFSENTSPALIQSTEDNSSYHVVMPMRA